LENPALIALCELYHEELDHTNDIAILEEIQPLIENLIKESNDTNSYLLQTNAYLLQGKLSLLNMNLGDARLYLTKAQQVFVFIIKRWLKNNFENPLKYFNLALIVY